MPLLERAFFAEEAAKLTREHVIPQWITELAPDDWAKAADPFMYAVSVPEMLAEERYQISDKPKRPWADLQIKMVCETCNGGWMSRLETKAKHLLGNLLFAEGPIDTRFKRKDAESIAVWAWKTVLTIGATDSTHVYFPHT